MKKIEDILRENGILTLEEGSRMYKVSESNLRNLISGKIKTYNVEDHEKAYVGGTWFIRQEVLDRYYKKRKGVVAYKIDLTGKKLKKLIENSEFTYEELSQKTSIPTVKLLEYEREDSDIPTKDAKLILKYLK